MILDPFDPIALWISDLAFDVNLVPISNEILFRICFDKILFLDCYR